MRLDSFIMVSLALSQPAITAPTSPGRSARGILTTLPTHANTAVLGGGLLETAASAAKGNPVASSSSSGAAIGPSANGVDAVAYKPGSCCEREGTWNCIAGTAFQRCGSGEWSAVLPMAAGTRCKPGEGTGLGIVRGARLRWSVGSR
jgi:hypothetical protein